MGVEGRSDDIVPGAATMCVEGICQIGGKEAPDGSQSAPLESTILHCTRVGGFKCRKPGGEQVDDIAPREAMGIEGLCQKEPRRCQEAEESQHWSQSTILLCRKL